jgi:hypothetical protein
MVKEIGHISVTICIQVYAQWTNELSIIRSWGAKFAKERTVAIQYLYPVISSIRYVKIPVIVNGSIKEIAKFSLAASRSAELGSVIAIWVKYLHPVVETINDMNIPNIIYRHATGLV